VDGGSSAQRKNGTSDWLGTCYLIRATWLQSHRPFFPDPSKFHPKKWKKNIYLSITLFRIEIGTYQPNPKPIWRRIPNNRYVKQIIILVQKWNLYIASYELTIPLWREILVVFHIDLWTGIQTMPVGWYNGSAMFHTYLPHKWAITNSR